MRHRFLFPLGVPILVTLAVFAHCAEPGSTPPAKSEPDTEELIQQLSSEDFDLREKATQLLSQRAELIWPRLKQLATSSDGEIKARALRAMIEPGKHALTRVMATLQEELAVDIKTMTDMGKLAAAEQAENEREIEANAKLAELEKTDIDPAKLDDLLKRSREIHDLAAARQREAKKIFDAKIKFQRDKKNHLTSRISQLKQIIASGVFVLPENAKNWYPALLPFESRLALHVTFEFVDNPLPDVIAFLAESTALKFEIDPAIEAAGFPTVNLRVSGMEAQLSLKWICRLCEVELKIDTEKQRILITQKKTD